ncbi:MAG: class II fructose-bisphosphate aldolase [Firmicutes bacterium]|nr:class II fructose-bisphosphate aldolase [Bacillota bacterium]
MSLVNMIGLLKHARANGYAIPAFNVTDLQSTQVILEVCEEERAPCLLEIAEPTITKIAPEYFAAIARAASELAGVPVALHYDHGKSFDLIVRCIRAGFTSVMIDGSEYEYTRNAEVTRRVVEVAHACGVGVEAEIGHVGVGEGDETDVEKGLTDPREAERFVAETGVDALAVAVGTAHGMYRFEPKIYVERLKEIAGLVKIPLVIHGGSQTPGLEKTLGLGVAKVNIFTDLQIPIREKVKEMARTQEFDKLFAPAIWGAANRAFKETARDKIQTLGAAGKAWLGCGCQ